MKNNDFAKILTSKNNQVSLLTEHRLYREEQFSIDKSVLTVRNCLNWIMRINKLITHFKYSYRKAIMLALKIKLPTERTKVKDWYSFHLENCLFRLLAMWDIYAQLINEFYDLGFSKDDCSLWKCIRRLKSKRGQFAELAKKIERYCNKPIHQFVRKDLRNSFAHNMDPHEMQIFHYLSNDLVKSDDTFKLPAHPFKELLFVLNDFRKLHAMLDLLNSEIEELMSKDCILIESYFITECGKKISDGQYCSIKVLDEVRGVTEVSDDGQICSECQSIVGNSGLKYHQAKAFMFHRIHEPDFIYGIVLNQDEK